MPSSIAPWAAARRTGSYITRTARQLLLASTLVVVPAAVVLLVPAHTAQAAAADSQASDIQAAFKEAQAAQVSGPSEIALKDQAVLKMPAGFVWVPEPAAGRLMRAMGNSSSDRQLGLIFPQAENEGWMAVVQFEDSGYIKDDDARNWNVDDLFKSLKEGTEAANDDRRERGFQEIEIIGWVEKPAYDEAAHRLIWSMSARDKGTAADDGASINYNTYALGRDGYITLNLITDLRKVAQDKQHAQALLGAMEFKDGKRYADFDASTDKTAEYGLAALVGGVAAKKLGLFALAAGLFAKFAKVILLAGIGLLGVLTKVFKRKT